MNKRYQVFVSSTYNDLQDERREVIQALLELDCIPAGMELFPASNDDQWTLIRRVIDDCDYYILIIGGRYGSIGDNNISYTQMEYEYALKTNKPIIAFIHKNPDSLPYEKTEKSQEGREKLDRFKRMVMGKLIRYWETPSDLGAVVSRSMVRLIRDFPAEGWIRANSAIDLESAKELARIQLENQKLLKKIHEYEIQNSDEIKEIAQKDDLYSLEFVCKFYDPRSSLAEIESKYVSYELTWNYIFRQIGALLFFESTAESKIERNFMRILQPQIKTILHTQAGVEAKDIISIELIPGMFRQILIQFTALGLIQRLNDTGEVKPSDRTERKWGLTEYGKKEGLKLMAIRRERI